MRIYEVATKHHLCAGAVNSLKEADRGKLRGSSKRGVVKLEFSFDTAEASNSKRGEVYQSIPKEMGLVTRHLGAAKLS